jgi:hypothetical protein
MDIIEEFSKFFVGISNISNSSSSFSVETEVDPTPFTITVFLINLLKVINLIMTSIEFHVIGRED